MGKFRAAVPIGQTSTSANPANRDGSQDIVPVTN